MRNVRQRMDFIVDDSSVLPIGKPADILVWYPHNDLSNDLFALTPHDHVDIRTTVEQSLDFLRRLMASSNCADLRRQLGHEITDLVESGFPLDAYAKKIDFVPDKTAEYLRVLVNLLIPKVKEGHLSDEVFHARRDVLKAGWGEKPLDGSVRIPEIRVQGENVLVPDHFVTVAGKNGRCK